MAVIAWLASRSSNEGSGESASPPEPGGTMTAFSVLRIFFYSAPLWLAPWAYFAAVSREKTPDLSTAWPGAGLLVAANFLLLVDILSHRRYPLPMYAVVGGFLITFLALVGAYARVDLAASHQLAAHTHKMLECYTDSQDHKVTLTPANAIYFALATVTTTGFGDIVPHSATCRWLTSSELAFAFPILGLSIGVIAGRAIQSWNQERER